MKKSLLVSLILLSGILLTACGKKSEETTQNVEPTEVIKVSDCEKAIQEYLEKSDKKGSGEEIKVGDNVVVQYIGRLEDGTVFDTNIESIAKACGKYITGGNYIQGLSFEVGSKGLIEGFNEGVIGMKLGQTKTVQFGPEKGYGEYDKDAIVTAPTSQFGDINQFKEGDTIDLGIGMPVKILKITDKEITFDLNSELAGKNLIFDITINEILGSNKSENITSEQEITPEAEK